MIKSRLAGLPESALKGAKAAAAAKGLDNKWRFHSGYSIAYPFMRYADDESLRKEMMEAMSAVGRSTEMYNLPVIKEIFDTPKAEGTSLPFDQFPDLVLKIAFTKRGRSPSFCGRFV